jgi:hypothetical protein
MSRYNDRTNTGNKQQPRASKDAKEAAKEGAPVACFLGSCFSRIFPGEESHGHAQWSDSPYR